MKKRLIPILYFLLLLFLVGCTINIAQQAVSTPVSPSPTPPTVNVTNSTTPVRGATTIPITWSQLNLTGRLVYIVASTSGDPLPKIQVLDLATGEIRTIFATTTDDWIFYVTISPDEKQLVMSYIPPSQGRIPKPNRALYTMPLDGSVAPKLLFPPPTSEDHYVHAEWSPDGKYIYYAHYNSTYPVDEQLNPLYTIFRIAVPDGQPEKIADRSFWPRLSSDPSKIVYVFIEPVSGLNHLFVANADGSNPQEVTLSGSGAPTIIDAPIFSPDGQTILFSAPPAPQAYKPGFFDKLMGVQVVKAHSVPSDWWSVPISGGVPSRLTQLQTINLFASISPEKNRIASVSGEGIFVMNLDGSNLLSLIFDSGVLGTVRWLS